MHTYYPSHQEVEAGGSGVQGIPSYPDGGQPVLHETILMLPTQEK